MHQQVGSEVDIASLSNVDELVKHIESFVWNKACQQMGRPSTNLQDYIEKSNKRIAEWVAQHRSTDQETRTKIKNKIAALKSRMKDKAKKEEKLIDLGACQSNFKVLAKIMSSTKCESVGLVRHRILVLLN